MGIEWTFCPPSGAGAGVTEPPDLATAKGDTPAGRAWTMFVYLQNDEGGDIERIIQVTFLAGVGLLVLLGFCGSNEKAAAEAKAPCCLRR